MVVSQALPHFLGRRGRGVSYAAERDEEFEGIEVFHSIETMLRKPHKEVAEENQKLYWYEEVRPKV